MVVSSSSTPPSTTLCLHEAFAPLGATSEFRGQQFRTAVHGVKSYANDASFWVAVYCLGIDCDVKKDFEQLAQECNAPAEFHSDYSCKISVCRVLGSLGTVRKRWGDRFYHTLLHHGITIDTTNIPVQFASGLSKVATFSDIDPAIVQLKRALARNYPGPAPIGTTTTTNNGVRCLRTADFNTAYNLLKGRAPSAQPDDREDTAQEGGETGQEGGDAGQEGGDTAQEEAARPRKKRRTRPPRKCSTAVPSPERARGQRSGQTHMGGAPSRIDLIEEDDCEPPPPESPHSPITPAEHLLDQDDGVHTSNIDPDLLYAEDATIDISALNEGNTFNETDLDNPYDTALVPPTLGEDETSTPTPRTLQSRASRSRALTSRTPIARSPITRGTAARTSLLRSIMPPKRKSTEDADVFTRFARIHGEVKQELVAAHTAVEVAAEGLRRATQHLSEIVDKCYALAAPVDEGLLTPSSASNAPDQVDSGRSTTAASARLNAKIASLEEKTDDIEGVNQEYAAFFAKVSAFPSLSSKLPGLAEFQEGVEEERQLELDGLTFLRKELEAATRLAHDAKNLRANKVAAYKKLQASWNSTKALRQWEPEDLDEDMDTS